MYSLYQTQDQVSITLNMPNFPEIKMGKRNVEDGVVRVKK